MLGPNTTSFQNLKDHSSFHTYNASQYEYVTLYLEDDTTVDLYISGFLNCLNLLVYLGS